MKIGIGFGTMLGSDPDFRDVLSLGQRAEALGFHSFTLGDHVLMPTAFDVSAYPAGGGEYLINSPWYDPFVVLAAIAGATKTIRIGTGIVVAPYRPPVQQAQAVATLDFISGGRFSFGIGIGWMKEEYAALQIPFSERSGRMRETVELMKLLWSGDGSPYHGKYFDFSGGKLHPTPMQKPHPPLIIGGDGMPAFKRIVEFGDGFLFNFKTLSEFTATVDELGPMMKDAGRDLSSLQMKLATVDMDQARDHRAQFAQYEALGLDEIILIPHCASADEGFAELETLARDFLA